MESILSLIYPDEEIYIKDFSFLTESLAVKTTIIVPEKSYGKQMIPYVTAENYVRCLSQASYLLGYHILKHRLIKTTFDEKSFLNAMEKWQLYYRNLSMTFHHRAIRGEAFVMELELKNFKEIKRIEEYLLFSFTNKKTVIGGEMSFVFVR